MHGSLQSVYEQQGPPTTNGYESVVAQGLKCQCRGWLLSSVTSLGLLHSILSLAIVLKLLADPDHGPQAGVLPGRETEDT